MSDEENEKTGALEQKKPWRKLAKGLLVESP
jgi:hypothetical protein